MRSSVILTLLFCMSISAEALPVMAHTYEQTNALIRAMLRSSLVRPNFDTATQSFMTFPRNVHSQEDFFGSETEWSAEDKKAAFDWYLRNLHLTAATHGMISGRRLIDNPIACAAIGQCEAMAYTNALPALIEHIGKDFDPSRVAAIRFVVEWSRIDEALTAIVESVVTNDQHYTALERNATYLHFCKKINGMTNVLEQAESQAFTYGVDAMYAKRCDPLGAVSIDKMLVNQRSGYSNSLDRYTSAISVLTNEISSAGCVYYFMDVTNQLMNATQSPL